MNCFRLELQELAAADFDLALTGFDPQRTRRSPDASGQRRASRYRAAAAGESGVPAGRSLALRQPPQPTPVALRGRD